MLILGVDPGLTTGWAHYCTKTPNVFERGQFSGAEVEWDLCAIPEVVVIERPKGYGPTRPELVDAGWVAGRLYERMRGMFPEWTKVEEMTRIEVKKILSAATHGEIIVRNDSTAWAALKLLHGDGCDKKPRRKKGQIVDPGGCIGNVKSHERAALAVAVAWWLKSGGSMSDTGP